VIYMEKTCQTHHVLITTPEMDAQHMSAECVIYETGLQGLGGIEPVTQAPAYFATEMEYETVQPYHTTTEKKSEQ
jgi:hypothetical protein